MFGCDIAHRQSVTVLCMLYKIRCNPMHPLYGGVPVPYADYTHCFGRTLVYVLIAAEPRSAIGFLFPSQCFCGTILSALYSMVWDRRGSTGRASAFLLAQAAHPLLSSSVFALSCFFVYGGIVGLGS